MSAEGTGSGVNRHGFSGVNGHVFSDVLDSFAVKFKPVG